jgi:hypothetical protein
MSDERPTKIILAEVIAVIPEYHQTIVETDTGYQYAIVETTKGIHWRTLKEGDQIELEVYTAIPIVKEVLHVI